MFSTSSSSLRTLGLYAGASAAVAFVAYCFYFDRQRRLDPLFKKKLREKRRQAQKLAMQNKGPPLPDFSDKEAVNRFFLQEVQMGEELLSQGDVENAVEHLSLAVAVCGQPHSLLSVLQQTLPPQIYHRLLASLDLAQQRVKNHLTSSKIILSSRPSQEKSGSGSGDRARLNEDDVE